MAGIIHGRDFHHGQTAFIIGDRYLRLRISRHDVTLRRVHKIERRHLHPLCRGVLHRRERDVERGRACGNDVLARAVAAVRTGTRRGRGTDCVVRRAGRRAAVHVINLHREVRRSRSNSCEADRRWIRRRALRRHVVRIRNRHRRQAGAGEMLRCRARSHRQWIREAIRRENERIKPRRDAVTARREPRERVIPIAVRPRAAEGGAVRVRGIVRRRIVRHIHAFQRQRICAGDGSTDGEVRRRAHGDQNRLRRALALHVRGRAEHLIVPGGAPGLRLHRAVIERVVSIIKHPRIGQRVAVWIARRRGESHTDARAHARGTRSDAQRGRLIARRIADLHLHIHRRRHRGRVVRHGREVDVEVRITERAAHPQRGIVSRVRDGAAETSRCHVQQLRTAIAAIQRCPAAATDAAQAPLVKGHHQTIGKTHVRRMPQAELRPEITLRIPPHPHRIAQARVRDGVVRLADAIQPARCHIPELLRRHPAQRVFKARRELPVATAAAHHIEGIAVFQIIARPGHARRRSAPVVRMPHAQIMPQLVKEDAAAARLHAHACRAHTSAATIAPRTAAPAYRTQIVARRVIAHRLRDLDGVVLQQRVTAAHIRVVAVVPFQRVRQHHQRWKGIRQVAATVTRLHDVVVRRLEHVMALLLVLRIDRIIRETGPDIKEGAIPRRPTARDRAGDRRMRWTAARARIQFGAELLPVRLFLIAQVLLRDLRDVTAAAHVNHPLRRLKSRRFLRNRRQRSVGLFFHFRLDTRDWTGLDYFPPIIRRNLANLQNSQRRIIHRHLTPNCYTIDRDVRRRALPLTPSEHMGVVLFAFFGRNRAGIGLHLTFFASFGDVAIDLVVTSQSRTFFERCDNQRWEFLPNHHRDGHGDS